MANTIEEVWDAARLAMQFTSCSRLKYAFDQLYRLFRVIEVNNRIARPTALGWRDITVMVEVPLHSKIGERAEHPRPYTFERGGYPKWAWF